MARRPVAKSAEGHVPKIWDLERGSDPEVLEEHAGTITAVALSSDGQGPPRFPMTNARHLGRQTSDATRHVHC
jgi:hypothetical protein